MRFAYSAQACSAQPGSLPPSATTWSLGTRLRLALFLGFCFFRGHGLAAPDLFQVVELTDRGVHDVDHHIPQVDQHPFAARLALDPVDAPAELLDALLHALGERI